MVTKEQLFNADGMVHLHYTGKHRCSKTVGPRGGVTVNVTEVRQSGSIKTWKTRPNDFHMPVKYGLRESWYVDQDNAKDFHLASECPLLAVSVNG